MSSRYFNPLQAGVTFLYSLKISENLKGFDVFRGYRKATPGCDVLSQLTNKLSHSPKGWCHSFFFPIWIN